MTLIDEGYFKENSFFYLRTWMCCDVFTDNDRIIFWKLCLLIERKYQGG